MDRMRKGLLFSVLLSTAMLLILLAIPFTGLHWWEGEERRDKSVDVGTSLWYELGDNQQENGSWDDDFETTQIASNALIQGVNLMDEHPEDIELRWEQPEDLTQMISDNTQSIIRAQAWTIENYQEEEPIVTQGFSQINFFLFCAPSQETNISARNIYLQSSDIILSAQNHDGSWDSSIRTTALSLYSLKKDDSIEPAIIERGEQWLFEQKKDDDGWGSVENDSLALLGLMGSTYDLGHEVDHLISQQSDDGSFGSIETTVWAEIALSSHDSPSSTEAASDARDWSLSQPRISIRELALICLAESEYITYEIERLDNEPVLVRDKGPPHLYNSILTVVTIMVIILIALFLRLNSNDAMTDIRKEIYDHITSHPGINQNALKRRVGISSSSIRHHLRVLERYDHIISHDDGRYMRYYVNRNGYSSMAKGSNYKSIIALLRKDTASNIVRYVRDNPDITQTSLARALSIDPSTVHWHTRSLLSLHIISAKRSGRSVRYRIDESMDLDTLLSLAN